MATVNISAANYAANGAAGTGSADVITITTPIVSNKSLVYGMTIGVFKDEAESILVSMNSSLSGTPGNAAGGEPAYDGKDVFIPVEALLHKNVVQPVYVISTSGTVNYWVTLS